jgi:hypothetical protein
MWREGRRSLLLALATATATGVAAAAGATIERLLAVLPLSADAAHAVRVSVLLGLVVWIAHAASVLMGARGRRAATLALLAAPAAVAAAVILFGRPLAANWREWQSTLRAPGAVASQEVLLPASLEPPLSAVLKLDLLPLGAGAGDVVVRANGKEIRRYRGGLARRDAELPTKTYYEQLFVARRRTTEPERAWYAIQISPDLLQPGGRLTIELAVEGEGGGLVVFGDFPPSATAYAGPSLFSPRQRDDTSIYKYLAEDDFRMRRSVGLGAPGRSSYFDGRQWSERDLGPEAGRQRGRYRIFLVLGYPDEAAVL